MEETNRTLSYKMGYLCGAIQTISEKVDFGAPIRKQIWDGLVYTGNIGKVFAMYQSNVLSRARHSCYRHENDHVDDDVILVKKLMNEISYDGDPKIDEVDFTYGFMAFTSNNVNS